MTQPTGFNPSESAVIYVYAIDGNHTFTGYGITGDIKRRRREHLLSLNSQGCSIVQEYVTPSITGHLALKTEKMMLDTFPRQAVPVEGFKKENTTSPFDSVVRLINEQLEGAVDATIR